MYNNYGFVLNWRDLDEDLKEQKISDYIEYSWNANDYDHDEHDLDWYLEDADTRKDAERSIEARFPMYF